jgi:hypothetical protein
MVRHQIRWARSTRISRRWVILRLILTYGTALALLTVVADEASKFSLALLAFTLMARLTMGWVDRGPLASRSDPEENLWLLPVRDLLSFRIWCLSWIGRRVEWRAGCSKRATKHDSLAGRCLPSRQKANAGGRGLFESRFPRWYTRSSEFCLSRVGGRGRTN